MLERAASRLESGSLRHLLPSSQIPLKSRRKLHSAFWAHGAEELEPPRLWDSFARGADYDGMANNTQSVSTAGVFTAGFLDFLYPLGAIKSVRKYSSWVCESQDGKRAHTRSGRLSYRLYTSLAGITQISSSDMPPMVASGKPHQKEDEASKLSHIYDGSTIPVPSLANMIDRKLDDTDLVWHHFGMLDAQNQNRLATAMLKYLCTSSRSVDAERSTSLFEQIHGQANEEQCQIAIKAYLHVANVQAAIKLHGECLQTLGKLIETSRLLAWLMKNSKWKLAFRTLDSFKRFRDQHPRLQYNIWSAVDSLPDLPDRAEEVARFMNHQLNNSGTTSLVYAKEYASIFINRVLLAMADGKILDETKLDDFVCYLQGWKTDIPNRYEVLIAALLRSGHSKAATRLYRMFRIRTTRKISRPTLHEMLAVACDDHNINDMQQILEDWTRFYGQPTLKSYQLCMSAFARLGDVSNVHSLWNEYCSLKVRAGLVYKKGQGGRVRIYSPDEISPLLQVYAKRGELAEVKNIILSMKERFGVKPGIMSWNILLHAYAKVHEIGGAFNQFQNLLDSSTIPDSYTVGTMMGICVTRGDLKGALDLYQLGEKMGIPPSVSMINCLVLGHIQDGRLLEAEKICVDALCMDLEGPPTRMWNYLLAACAMRLDTDGLNRILGRMKNAGVEYDSATYSALMQSLSMLKQPDRSKRILSKVMRRTNTKPTSFHFAILMSGYIAVGLPDKAIRQYKNMLRLGIKESASTRWAMLKAEILKEYLGSQSGSEERSMAQLCLSEKYKVFDMKERAETMTTTFGRDPLNVAYPSAYYSYLMSIFSQKNDFNNAKRLFDEFIDIFSEERLGQIPLRILGALMVAYLKDKNYEGVQEVWELLFKQARELGQPIVNSFVKTTEKVLPLHQLVLASHLSTQITSLANQGKFDDLGKTLGEVEAAGFILDNRNWNHYIQFLAQSVHYKLAFELCEEKLMDGWTGWALTRLLSPVRSRLPLEVRYARRRKNPPLLRPFHQTLLLLIKVYAVLEDTAPRLQGVAELLDEIHQRCPKTIGAVMSIPRETIESAMSESKQDSDN